MRKRIKAYAIHADGQPYTLGLTNVNAKGLLVKCPSGADPVYVMQCRHPSHYSRHP